MFCSIRSFAVPCRDERHRLRTLGRGWSGIIDTVPVTMSCAHQEHGPLSGVT